MATLAAMRQDVGRNIGALSPFRGTVASATTVNYPGLWQDKTGYLVYYQGNTYTVRSVAQGVLTIEGGFASYSSDDDGAEVELWEPDFNPANINDFLNHAIREAEGIWWDSLPSLYHNVSPLSQDVPLPPSVSMVSRIEQRARIDSFRIDHTGAWSASSNVAVAEDAHDLRVPPAQRCDIGTGAATVTLTLAQAANFTKYTHLEGWVKATHPVNISVGFRNTDASVHSQALEIDDDDEWVYFRLELPSPYALVELEAVTFTLTSANSVLWLSGLWMVNSPATVWSEVSQSLWSVNAGRRTAEVAPASLDAGPGAVVRVSTGQNPGFLSDDASETSLPSYYCTTRATELAYSSVAGGRQTDPNDFRRQQQFWAARAQQARSELPLPTNARFVPGAGTVSAAGSPNVTGFLPAVSPSDNGDVLTVVNGVWAKARPASALPGVSGTDNGKFLGVASGVWGALTLPFTAIATGLNALTGAARVSYGSLKDTPTIPDAGPTQYVKDVSVSGQQVTVTEVNDGSEADTTFNVGGNPRGAGTGLTLNGNDLDVTNPFTDTYQAKLDGVEYGAQDNPKHVVSFRSENGSSGIAGQIYFIKADNTDWQGGSTNDIAAIEIHPTQFSLTQDPNSPLDIPGYQDWHSLPQDIVENMGATIWDFYWMGDTVVVPEAPTFRLRAATIIKNNDGNYVLQSIKALLGYNWTHGSGQNIQVAGVFAPYSPADGIVGVVDKGNLPGDVVYDEQLVGKETDRYFSYTNSASDTYWPGTIKFYDQTTGAPANANLVRQPDIAAGAITVAVGRPRTDRDPNNLAFGTEYAAADFVSGQVIHLSDWNHDGSSGTLTLTSGGTVVGTGNSRRVWFRATLALTGTDLPDVQDRGDYWRFAEESPTRLPIEIPASDVLNPPWVLTDGSNVTDELVDVIQGDNESVDLANGYRVDVNNVDYYIQFTIGVGGNPNICTVRLPSSAVGSQDDIDLTRLLKDRAWFDVGGYVIDITANATRSLIGTSLTFAFNYVVVDGTQPTGSTPVYPHIDGNDVHRGELARPAFKDENPSIGGGAAGTYGGKYFGFNSSGEPELKDGGGGGVTLTDDAVLDLAKTTRTSSDRGKALGTSATDEDELALLDVGSDAPDAPAAESTTKFYRLEVPSTTLGTDPLWSEDAAAETPPSNDAIGQGSLSTTVAPTESAVRRALDALYGEDKSATFSIVTTPANAGELALSNIQVNIFPDSNLSADDLVSAVWIGVKQTSPPAYTRINITLTILLPSGVVRIIGTSDEQSGTHTTGTDNATVTIRRKIPVPPVAPQTFWATNVGGTRNVITATASPNFVTGDRLIITPAHSNSGGANLTLTTGGAKTIRHAGANLTGGELRKDVQMELLYDGTYWTIPEVRRADYPYQETDTRTIAHDSGVLSGSDDSGTNNPLDLQGVTDELITLHVISNLGYAYHVNWPVTGNLRIRLNGTVTAGVAFVCRMADTLPTIANMTTLGTQVFNQGTTNNAIAIDHNLANAGGKYIWFYTSAGRTVSNRRLRLDGTYVASRDIPGRRTLVQNADVGATNEQLLTGLADDDQLELRFNGYDANNRYVDTAIIRWGDLTTNDSIMLGVDGNERVILVKQSATQLNGRRGGGLTNVAMKAYILEPED